MNAVRKKAHPGRGLLLALRIIVCSEAILFQLYLIAKARRGLWGTTISGMREQPRSYRSFEGQQIIRQNGLQNRSMGHIFLLLLSKHLVRPGTLKPP